MYMYVFVLLLFWNPSIRQFWDPVSSPPPPPFLERSKAEVLNTFSSWSDSLKKPKNTYLKTDVYSQVI